MNNMQNVTSIKIILCGILLYSSLFLSAQLETITPLYADNHQRSLNGTWKFKYIPGISAGSDSLFFKDNFDATGWGNIKVPGHWELHGFAEPTYGPVNAGLGLYLTTFRVPDSYKGKQVFIKFEGVLYGYDLYVNGRWAGNWASSYHAASFNISDFVEAGKENRLAVRVSTRNKRFEFDRCDNWTPAGISHDISIFSWLGDGLYPSHPDKPAKVFNPFYDSYDSSK